MGKILERILNDYSQDRKVIYQTDDREKEYVALHMTLHSLDSEDGKGDRGENEQSDSKCWSMP